MKRFASFPTVFQVVLAGLLISPTSLLAERPLPYDEGSTGLAFALRKLPVTGSFLHITAHPDDEDNALLVALGRGRGLRTGLLTLTRGDGGQNEIGPELFEALGVIRTGELMAIHRYDGAEQFFTRAYEFGYSFSVEETLQKWGREEILADIVRVIRQFRPDVIAILPRTGEGGGQHHQTSAILGAEAFRAAADPNRFPAQIKEGLRPWQASKLYERTRWEEEGQGDQEFEGLAVETGVFDPLFGRTWAQVGAEARSSHRCQGMSQIIPVAGPRASYWKLIDSAFPPNPMEDDFFDGVDISLFAVEKSVGNETAKAPFLHGDVEALQIQIEAAFESFDANDPGATAPYIANGLKVARQLRNKIKSSSLSDKAKNQIDFLLGQKQRDLERAFEKSLQLNVEALADDGAVVPGQEFGLTVTVSNGSSESADAATVKINVPSGWSVKSDGTGPAAIPGGGVLERKFRIMVGKGAEFTQPYWKRTNPDVDRFEVVERYATAPWADPPATVDVEFRSLGVATTLRRTAEFRYEGSWAGGEQRHDLQVVPAVSLKVQPEVAVIPLSQAQAGREVRVIADYQGTGLFEGRVEFELPPGWTAQPASQAIEFTRPGQSLTRIFRLAPPAGAPPSEFKATAVAIGGGETFRQGYQVIDYHHIRRQHLYRPSSVELKTLDVEMAQGLKIGYVEGVGDEVPEALRQLNVDFQFLSGDDLAFGDLSEFDTIVTGVRAYLVREDLKANNGRLLDWVKNGGNLIVQYNKFEFNEAFRGNSPYAPFPAKVGRDRVTDEHAEIQVLEPANPVFNAPNKIGAEDWAHWVQERGLYFLGEKDPQYRDLISTADPFPYNAGDKPGALVEAKYGDGTWFYIGLGLWRQLPAGVPGAYRLLANLISLPRTSGKSELGSGK